MVPRSVPYLMAAPTTAQFPPSPTAGHCEFIQVDELELDTSNLHAHVLDPTAKRRLLSFWSPSNVQGKHGDVAATSLLADLNRLAPSVAKDYLPKSVSRDNFAFRLINDLYFEGEEESYIAISYVWHKISRDTPKTLTTPVGGLPFGWVQTVEQFPLPTSKGMFQAVLNERRVSEGLWFDQVCINQEDEVEKAMAIGSMDTIYRNARVVVVALDDVSATAEEMQFLQQYHQQYASSDLALSQHPNRGLHPPLMQQHPLLRSFLERMLSSLWFERAWCAHEMRMGRSHVFLIPCEAEQGDESVYTIIRLTEAFFVHMIVLGSEVVSSPLNQQLIQSLLRVFASFNLPPQESSAAHRSGRRSSSSSFQSLIPTSAEVFSLKAGGNPRLPEHLRRLDANRDKTSISLNASGIPLVFKPPSPLQRPTMEDECLRQLLLIAIAARDPISLCTTGAPLQLHDGSISWLSKPTLLDLPKSYHYPPPNFPQTANPITQGSDGRAEYVQLDLVFLDLPHRTHPNPNFSLNVHRAQEIIDLCIRHQVLSHTLWNMWQLPNHPRAPAMRNIFIQTLACVFECGAAWLMDAIAQPFFPQGEQWLDHQSLEMLFSPQLVAQTYVNLPLLSVLLDTIASFIAQGIPWASNVNEHTHGPLIITTPPTSSTVASSVAYSPPIGGKAIIFAPYAYSKALLIGIPAAIKNTDYTGLARCWILTTNHPYTGSPKGTVSWVLRGKATIFGERAFNVSVAENDHTSARYHRVYGPGIGGT